MLQHLSIKNYALIDRLEVSFDTGFSVITGETGAGKSILLGGLALVLGKRADLSSLRDKDQKCIIEGQFEINKYDLKAFFDLHDLDYDPLTITRREILPGGKSRAFINDSPVTLDVLSKLGGLLIDVHSQHQTLQLTENEFQLKVIDALAGHDTLISKYIKQLGAYKTLKQEVQKLIDFQNTATKEHDYNSFLLKELMEAPLELGIVETLETQYEQLNNVEVIREQLGASHQLVHDEQLGLLVLLEQLKQSTSKIQSFGEGYENIFERIQSMYIEADDIASELQVLEDAIEADPQLLGEVSSKLQLIYDLQKKHNVGSISDLIEIRDRLSSMVDKTENITAAIEEKEAALLTQEKLLDELSLQLRKGREKAIPKFKRDVENTLSTLGMPSASFEIKIVPAEDFTGTGKDVLVFLFSANKGSTHGVLKKVASGGELSRIMLTIKSILAKYEQLPTLMFDEIDSGVSGEISNRMGDIMAEMSNTMQLFAITHLPQVASKGNHHYKVFKEEKNGTTQTHIRQLSQEERVVELAEMLGGKALSDSALAHARELLN